MCHPWEFVSLLTRQGQRDSPACEKDALATDIASSKEKKNRKRRVKSLGSLYTSQGQARLREQHRAYIGRRLTCAWATSPWDKKRRADMSNKEKTVKRWLPVVRLPHPGTAACA